MKTEWMKTKEEVSMGIAAPGIDYGNFDRATLISTADQFTVYIRMTRDEMEKLAFHLSATVQHLRRLEDEALNARSEAMHKEHMKP